LKKEENGKKTGREIIRETNTLSERGNNSPVIKWGRKRRKGQSQEGGGHRRFLRATSRRGTECNSKKKGGSHSRGEKKSLRHSPGGEGEFSLKKKGGEYA